jgi:hypothetical protein
VSLDVRERVRRAVYDSFASRGRAPCRGDVAALVSAGEAEVSAALEWLVANRHVVVDESGDIVMAHPFSSVNLGFSVMGSKTLWWGGCAWDSFAVPHLVPGEPRVLVATACPSCDAPLAWHVSRDEPPAGSEVAHFLVPMHDCWNDVVFTCSNQRIFCSPDCVDTWLRRTNQARGYVMDLPTLWRLASNWYSGRLQSPYERRDPVGAAEYFRSAGLHGPFWGLED